MLLKDRFLKEKKKQSAFLRKTIDLNDSFTLIENNFRFFKIAKFEFKVKVHCGLQRKMYPVVTP